jgi:hypothetical protein
MRDKLGIALILPLAAVLVSSDARAGQGIIAGACVPSTDTLEALKYRVVNGAYEFAAGQVGALNFTCPVPVPNSVGTAGYSGWMWTDNDDDGAATTDYYVKVEFRRLNKTTGAVDVQCTMVSQLSTPGPQICLRQPGVPANMLIDHVAYFHFVRVTVYRNAAQPAGQSIRFHAIEWNPY